MRFLSLIILICFSIRSWSQLTQLNSGTNENLINLSVIDNNIIICSATNNYLVKSYNECKQLIQLPCPSLSTNYYYLQRLDSNTLYLLAIGNGALLYKSIDGGLNWINKWNTGFNPSCVAFFDTLEGISDKGIMNDLLRTNDGGITWSSSTSPLYSIDIAKVYGDSTVLVAGANFPNPGGVFYLSNDRGHTWPYTSGLGGLPNDFFFLNKDTIFGVSASNNFGISYFTKSTNGGNTWQNTTAPLNFSNGISFRNKNNGYLVGADSQNNACIAKTNDLGQTWSIYNTGINAHLTKLAFINDSIAIITGNNGVILRWNYMNTVFTDIKKSYSDLPAVRIYPNPVKNKLHLDFGKAVIEKSELSLSNCFGQIVHSEKNITHNFEINLSELEQGIYFLNLSNPNEQKTFKIIKQ